MSKKAVTEKIIDYISSPRKGEWISIRALAKYIREPIEHVEYFVCLLTDLGMIQGVKDQYTGDYWLKHMWRKGPIPKKKVIL